MEMVRADLIACQNPLYQVLSAESTAKLFKNGRFQAVRLPKEFRGTEVKISKEGEKVINNSLGKGILDRTGAIPYRAFSANCPRDRKIFDALNLN
jgi:hypothetical protein